MKFANLQDMKGGWFVGDFLPNIAGSKDFEVAIKRYKAGQAEKKHLHAQTTEITVIVSGRAEMVDRELAEGEMVLLSPGDASAFRALEDTVTCVVKFPSLPDDKVFVE